MKKCAKLRGGRVDCEKMCEIKRGRRRVDCEKMCEIKRVGALRGGRRVDCEKMCEIKRGRRRVVRKNVRN